MVDTTGNQMDLILHQQQLSGNSYKIRLTASLIGRKIRKRIDYDVQKKETRTPIFLSQINPNGRVPVLQVGQDTFLPESNAACYYLADDEDAAVQLIPRDRLEHAQMLQWMFFEQYSHEPAIAVLRFWRLFVGEKNLTAAQREQIPAKEKQAREVLDVMGSHLGEGRKWFVAERMTLADVVLFAYTHRLHEAGFDVADWPKVAEWIERVQAVNGYVRIED